MTDYWQKRQEAMYKAGEMKINQYFSRLEKAFNQTKRELQKTIELFYFRYAEENSLSYAAAKKRLDAEELGELQDFIDLAMKSIGKYNQTVNNLSLKARITRYQALEMQVDAILRQLYAIDYEAEAEKTMKEVYEEVYYHTWYNADQYHRFHAEFAQITPTVVEKLLEYPFNGAVFSDRLWKQKNHLQTQLMEAVTTMLIQGKHPSTLTKDFAKKMQSKKFDAYRLLHTEGSFLMSEATHAGYEEDGVEKYEVLATLDSKTCNVCGELDGKEYKVGEEIVGVNMPPFHPLCRCTTVPYYDDAPREDLTRTARDARGKGIEVPADMTYKEWKKVLNDGGDFATWKKSVEKKIDAGIMELSEEELGVLYQYKSFESYTINDALRNAKDISELAPVQQQFVKELDSALLKMPKYEGNLIRTVNFSDWSDCDERTRDFIESFIPGGRIKNKEYWSTSKEEGYDRTAGIWIYIEDSKAGRDISTIGIDEKEVLYERNTEFTVINKIFYMGKWNILLREAT